MHKLLTFSLVLCILKTPYGKPIFKNVCQEFLVLTEDSEINHDIVNFIDGTDDRAFFNSKYINLSLLNNIKSSLCVIVAPRNYSDLKKILSLVSEFYYQLEELPEWHSVASAADKPSWVEHADGSLFKETPSRRESGPWRPHYHILLSDWKTPNFYEVLALLSQMFPIDSDIFISFNDTTFEIYSAKNKTFVNKLNSSHGILKLVNRRNLLSIPLAGVAMVDNRVEAKISEENGHFKFAGGFEVDHFWFLRDALNFSGVELRGSGWLNVISHSTNEYNLGTFLVTGIGAQIINGQADIAITSHSPHYRSEIFQFLHPTWYTIICAYVRQPSASSIRNVFFLAFPASLWLTLMSTWLVIVISILCMVKIFRKLLHKDAVAMNPIWLWAVTTLCQKGWTLCPQSMSLKIIVLVGLFNSLNVFVGYSAVLISMLSTNVIPIKRMSDIVDLHFEVFSDADTMPDVLPAMVEFGAVPNILATNINAKREEIFPKIFTSKIAFLSTPDNVYPSLRRMNETKSIHIDKLCQSFSEIKIDWNRNRGAMFVRKNSPFKEYFNYEIIRMFENGLNYRFMLLHHNEIYLNCPVQKQQDKPLDIDDLLTAFFIILAGGLLSLIFVFLESCYEIL